MHSRGTVRTARNRAVRSPTGTSSMFINFVSAARRSFVLTYVFPPFFFLSSLFRAKGGGATF